MQQALLLAAIDPGLGGVLVSGPRGTAKSTAARALAELLPQGQLVNLPLGASEDRLIGTLDIETVLRDGAVRFSPGLLAKAHEGVLYVDEVNLLPDARKVSTTRALMKVRRNARKTRRASRRTGVGSSDTVRRTWRNGANLAVGQMQFRAEMRLHGMRPLFLSLFLGGVLVVAAFADEDIRALQTKLKEGGYYFGEVNGQQSSDLAAAVTRYQIRNGLQITGKLDAETSKALGVNAEVTNTSATKPETWRQLRKAADRNVPNESPRHALRPAGNDETKMVLSPERLRDYVAAFVLAGLDPQVGSELEFFGDRVHYYNDEAELQRFIRIVAG